jgi:hypothetical protein
MRVLAAEVESVNSELKDALQSIEENYVRLQCLERWSRRQRILKDPELPQFISKTKSWDIREEMLLYDYDILARCISQACIYDIGMLRTGSWGHHGIEAGYVKRLPVLAKRRYWLDTLRRYEIPVEILRTDVSCDTFSIHLFQLIKIHCQELGIGYASRL